MKPINEPPQASDPKANAEASERHRAEVTSGPASGSPDGEPHWVHVHSVDEMEKFYREALPRMQLAAHECGYALAVHGSIRRDLDLIAAPWVAEHSDNDTLARAIQKAACGFTMAEYNWDADPKPCGRMGTVFPICWTEWHDMISAGHVDLSIMPDTIAIQHQLTRARERLKEALDGWVSSEHEAESELFLGRIEAIRKEEGL